MSDSAGELSVTIRGKDVGLKSLLAALETELRKADRAAEKTAQALGGGLAPSQQRAASTALQLAQANARLAVAQGDAARGATILRNALDQNTGASQRASVAAQTQLANLDRASAGAARTKLSFQGLTSALGAAGLAFGAAQFIQGGIALGELGLKVEVVNARFTQMAEAAGNSATALLAALRAASGGEISDLNLQLAANRANLLGVATSAEDLSVLLAIARDRAQVLGTSSTQAFNDLVEGLGKAEPEILDNLGIMVNLTQTYDAYAKTLGITANQLTVAQKSQALTNAVLAQGTASLQATGGAAVTTAATYAQLAAAAENAAAIIGQAIAQGMEGAARGAVVVLNEIGPALSNVSLGAQLVTDSTNNLNTAWSSAIGTVAQLSLGMTGNATNAQAAGDQAQAAASQFLTFIGVIDQNTAALAQNTSGGKQWGETNQVGASAADLAAQASAEHAQALVDETTKKLASAQAAQELAQFQSVLAGLSGQVASGHLSAGAAALILAQRYGVASGEAERLLALQAQVARSAGVASVAGIGGNVIKGFNNLFKSTTALVAANREYQETVGGTSVKLRNLETDLAKAKVGSLEYIKIQTDIARLKNSGAKGGTGGGGAGKSAGARDLKIQQDFANKSEDLEAAHQDRLTEIVEAAAEKRRDAEADFNQDALDGRADFYSSLIDMEDQGLAQVLAARYEAIQQQAAEIARTQGADAAQAFEDQAVKGLERQSKREQQIKEAESKGDAGRVEALKGVAALEQKADDARLARIREQGSLIAAEEAKRLQEEEQRLAESQGKLETKTARKLGTDPALPTPSGAADLSKPQAVIDVATPAAVDQQTTDLGGKLDAARAAIEALGAKLDGIKSEVAGLKSSRAFAGTA